MNGFPSRIKPKRVTPDADCMIVTGGRLTIPPQIDYMLGRHVPGAQDRIDPITTGTVQMTKAQWDAWGSKEKDADYMLKCVAEILGVKLTP